MFIEVGDCFGLNHIFDRVGAWQLALTWASHYPLALMAGAARHFPELMARWILESLTTVTPVKGNHDLTTTGDVKAAVS